MVVDAAMSHSLWVILFQLAFQWDEFISFILVTKSIARMTLNLSWSELKVVVLRNLMPDEILKIHDVWKWSIDIISGSVDSLTSCSIPIKSEHVEN